MKYIHLALLCSFGLPTMAQTEAPRRVFIDDEVIERFETPADDNAAPLEEIISDDVTLFEIEPLSADSAYMSLLNRPVEEPRELYEILASLPGGYAPLPFNALAGPWVFSGYRPIKERSFADVLSNPSLGTDSELEALLTEQTFTPGWLHDALTQARISQDYMYASMVYTPKTMQYTYWGLPEPPRLPEDDVTLGSYIRNMDLPEVTVGEAILPEFVQQKKHWLHKFNTGLQFSQAYVSKNWYQGGNNYLALLFNFFWDVQLNPTYHKDQIFQSTFSYKLGVNSIEQNAVGRKYSLSEDLLQYNVKYGFKAFKNWFYTLTGQFKTQFFKNYKTNTDIRTASLLSPADLNLGVGMTYSRQNKKKTFNIAASIAPFSYNLKICLDERIDHGQFNIKPGKKTHSEYGSSGEVNMTWQPASNVSMRTRFFAFTDYSYFQGNVETTWDFKLNKYLSTQIYANLRYDSNSDFDLSRWHHWMLKEILSFGLSYSFSTK